MRKNLPINEVQAVAFKFNGLLNNIGLNHTGPLIHGFFLIVNARVLHDMKLVECRCRTKGYGGANCKVALRF